MSASADVAVAHLKATKPLGAWSVESKGGAYRLLRRKIAVTDSYFLDIHYDTASRCVVGILSRPKSGKAQGQVLVDQDGKLTGTSKVQIISVAGYDPNKKRSSASGVVNANRSNSTRSSATTNTANSNNTLTHDQNKQLLQYAVYFLGSIMILRALTQAVFAVSLLFVPMVYLYALQSCPSENSFDAKKELRRILRGHHLPENHEAKPKGWLNETIARVNAAVTTELATGLGYEVSMRSFGGAAWLTCVRVPTNKIDFYWIGAFDKWIYVYSQNYENQD